MALKKGLGKGLDALFLDNNINTNSSDIKTIRVSEIEPNRQQPRKDFSEEALHQLADSIREHGIIQPIIVRPISSGGYQIIAGERRFRASRMVGLSEIPVVIRDIDNTKTMEFALIENLQREDLNPIEEATGYQDLMQNHNMTQADISKSVGKSRSAIANTVRLLNLPEKTIAKVSRGEISSGHARALLALESSELIEEMTDKIIKDQISVRELERIIGKSSKLKSSIKASDKKDNFFNEMEIALNNELGRSIKIKYNGKKGILEIPFYSKQELSDLAARIAGNKDY